jgi:hypothetical protein
MGRPWHRKVGEIRRLYPPPLAPGSARIRATAVAEGSLAAGVERLACGRENVAFGARVLADGPLGSARTARRPVPTVRLRTPRAVSPSGREVV